MGLCSLPDEVIGHIFETLSIGNRLASAAACQKLLHIATTGTRAISLFVYNRVQADSFTAYLQHYGGHLKSVDVRSYSSPMQLQQGPDGNWGGLLQCTALTHLELSGCTIEDHKSAALMQLTALPSLQHLSLCNVQAHSGSPTPVGAQQEWVEAEFPVGLLPHLSSLTYLELCDGVVIPDIALLQLAAVSQLQVLELHSTDISAVAFGSLHQLQQLTRLRLWAPQVRISQETTPGFSKLTALQTLMLYECAVDPRVLAGLSNLQLFMFQSPRSAQQDGAALLAALPKLQKLQSLELSCTKWQWPALTAAYRGLAASSQLTGFHFINITVPRGAWQVVFGPGQHFPQLQHMSIYHEDDWDAGMIDSLLLSTADVQNMVACCPALHTVSVMLRPSADLSAFTQLSALSKLSLTGLSAAGLRSIAGSTSLVDLELQSTGWAKIPWEWLLPVTAMRQLTRLACTPEIRASSSDDSDDGGEGSWEASLHLNQGSRSPGQPSEVWAQLVKELAGQRRTAPSVTSSLAQQLVQAEERIGAMQQQLDDAHRQLCLQRQQLAQQAALLEAQQQAAAQQIAGIEQLTQQAVQLEAQQQTAAQQEARMQQQLAEQRALLEASSASQAAQLAELQRQVQRLASMVQGQETSSGGVSM